MALVACSVCGKPYPENGVPYKCICGGIFDYVDFPAYGRVQGNISSGLGTYLPSLGLPADAELISLGEGNTPLIPYVIKKKKVFLKMEGHNPSGSYKDRGSAVLASFLKSRGVNFAVEDSSGNAGASFAAYCARAGIHAKVFAPDSASGPKRIQIEAYGANLVLVPVHAVKPRKPFSRSGSGSGVRKPCLDAVRLMRHRYDSLRTFLQLGEAAGTIYRSVWARRIALWHHEGLENLAKAGLINRQPYFVGYKRKDAPLSLMRIGINWWKHAMCHFSLRWLKG
jgi:threonine synthase